MAICEMCGAEFEEAEAREFFEDECSSKSYDNFNKCLCGDCAVSVIYDEEDGIYFETCDRCGKTFDYIVENADFEESSNGTSLNAWGGGSILCYECAMSEVENS